MFLLLTLNNSFIKTNQDRINRILFDEVHQLVVSTDYRGHLYNCKDLNVLNIPKIYLTATLPPNFEKEFLDRIGIKREHITIIRTTTNRPELIYSFIDVNKQQNIVEVAAALVRSVHYQFFKQDSRGIIFCQSKDISCKLGQILGTPTCNSDNMERDVAQQVWRRGKQEGDRWMSATSSFIHGVDYPFVDCIVFVNLPYGLIDFVQASARGGRRGRPCQVIVIHNSTLETPKDPDYKLTRPMNSWSLSTTKCRRELISQHMDGVMVTCHTLPNALPCDICKPRSTFRFFAQQAIRSAKPSNLTIHQYMMVQGEVSRTQASTSSTPNPTPNPNPNPNLNPTPNPNPNPNPNLNPTLNSNPNPNLNSNPDLNPNPDPNLNPNPQPSLHHSEPKMPSPTLGNDNFGIPDEVFQQIPEPPAVHASSVAQSTGKCILIFDSYQCTDELVYEKQRPLLTLEGYQLLGFR